ncbi:MAG: hypothetical protein J6W37_00260 [Bacteroidales bacterium]|nr:hypothetical protein [Bacteroidales bacterium]
MKKRAFLRLALQATLCLTSLKASYADSYDPEKIYQKGDETEITINGVDVSIVYLNDSPSSNFVPSTPYDNNNSWLWSVSGSYKGEWVPFHYVLFDGVETEVQYAGNTYKLLQEMWPSSPSPSVASADNWGWECQDCAGSSVGQCRNPYSTDYYPISLAQLNNGADNTTPPNASGDAETISGLGGDFVNINQERSCNTPFALYNNDLYFRDGCDPHSGIGYYGVSDNTNVPAPQKRLFADTDTDGPVLYGWNGGALGIRQRNNLSAVNGPHIEKIALQWTPSNVYIGTEKLPMLFTTYNTIYVKGIKGTRTGLYVSGTEKTKAIQIYDLTNGGNSFVVYGNGVVNAKKIYTEEVEVLANVNGSRWPDYVFEKDYKLRSLHELGQYISENKHLPDVPSALEMEGSKINLAEANMVLLKKVEELTLYVLDLQQQIDKLNQNEERK